MVASFFCFLGHSVLAKLNCLLTVITVTQYGILGYYVIPSDTNLLPAFRNNLLPLLSGLISFMFEKTLLFTVTAITSNLIFAVAVKECKHLFSPVFEHKFIIKFFRFLYIIHKFLFFRN